MNDNQRNDTPVDDSKHQDQEAHESPSATWYTPLSPADPTAAATRPVTAERGAPEELERYSTREPPPTQIALITRARTFGSASIPVSRSNSNSSREAVVEARFGSYRPHVLVVSSPESMEDTPMSDSPRSLSPVLFASAEPANTAPSTTSAEETIPDEFMQLALEEEGPVTPSRKAWKIVTRQEFQARQQKDAAEALSRRRSLPDTSQLEMENNRALDGPSAAGETITTGLGSQTGVEIMDFAMAPGSRVPLDQAAKAAMVAARINEQFEIKRALEARSTFLMDQTAAGDQFAPTTDSMNEHSGIKHSAEEVELLMTKDQASIDRSTWESELTMGREEEISPRKSIRESQPSKSIYIRVLGLDEERQSQAMWASFPPHSSRAANSNDGRPILRHAFICDLCNQTGHRWMNCINTCRKCGQMHEGYLTCTSLDKKRKDGGEGEDKAGSKRIRKDAIDE